MSKVFSFKIGDSGHDGHGWVEEQHYELWHADGSPVEDETLRASVTAATEALGFGLDELCQDYESGMLFCGQVESIVAAGFVQPQDSLNPRARTMRVDPWDTDLLPEGWPMVTESYGRPSAYVNTFDFVAWLLRYSNPALQVRAIEFTSLETVGVKSFGYGLFSA